MLGALKRVLGVSAKEPCAGCDPAILARCKQAEAGSVTPHAYHVFIKLPAPPGADPTVTDESWWPERLDDGMPLIASTVAAIKEAGERIHGKVKVTAFDYLDPWAQQPGTADVYIFPDGLYFRALPQGSLLSTVVEALEGATARRSQSSGAPTLEQQAAALGGTCLQGTVMFVCCHASRDERCGHIGPALAAKLSEEVALKGLEGGIDVLKTSHVGGHAYAGNVVVFSRGKLFHGDWFGGLNAKNAAAFLNALLNCQSPHGPPGDYNLHGWWRGRIGMTKEQQLACFKKATGDIEDMVID